jgi:hypothetical protein
MNHDPDLTSSRRAARWTRADFELAAALKEGTEVPDAPPSLYRPVPWRRAAFASAGALAALVLGGWAFVEYAVPPQIVREAFVHEEREATLRGDFQPDKTAMLRALGMRDGATLPGLVQLQRPCDIDRHMAYHVTTFLEKGGGIVTILAFEQALPDAPAGQGRWFGRHWRFADVAPGKTVLLLGDNEKALATTERYLKQG